MSDGSDSITALTLPLSRRGRSPAPITQITGKSTSLLVPYWSVNGATAAVELTGAPSLSYTILIKMAQCLLDIRKPKRATQMKPPANQSTFKVGDTVDCAVGHERYDELLNDMGIPSTTVFTEVLDGEHLAVNVDGTWLTGNIVAFGPRGNVAIKLTAVEPENTATE